MLCYYTVPRQKGSVKNMTPAIQTFVHKILKCEDTTTRQIAVHEAGHRFFWGIVFPDIKTKYAVVSGMPATVRKSGNHPLNLQSMTIEDASRYIYIKLGGIAAEMVLFGIENAVDEIAESVADDYVTEHPQFDWRDDAEHHGDISETFKIIQAKSNPESLKHNFKIFLQSSINHILSNKDMFDKECAEATNLFAVWQKQGRWSL